MSRAARIASLLLPIAAMASPPPEPGGRIRAAEGGAAIFAPHASDRLEPELNTPVPEGTTIRTSDGRIEVDLAPGSTFRLAGQAEMELKLEEGRWTLALTRGQLEVEVWGGGTGAPARLSTEFGTVAPEQGSVVLLTRLGASAIVDVREGVAEVRHGGFGTLVTAPGRLLLRHGTPSFAAPETATGRLRDDFRVWVEERRATRRRERGGASTLWESYGEELRAGGLLVPCPWGAPACFAPEVAGFEPPGDGHWVELKEGRAWVSEDPWGWITSHYGSWSQQAGRWWWRPGGTFRWEPVISGPPEGGAHPLDALVSTPPAP